MKRRYKKCECNGSGQIVDSKATGAAGRAMRREAKITLPQMAREIGRAMSAVHYFETGDREWSSEQIDRYIVALEKLRRGERAKAKRNGNPAS